MGVVTRKQANQLVRQLTASRITSFNYSLVFQVVFSMAKMIHLMMSGWFLAVNVVMTNSCANATNSNAKATKSIAKPMNSIANGTNSTAKAMNSTAKGTKSIAKPVTIHLVGPMRVRVHKYFITLLTR